jgi:SAM-dependent methyltransferase
MDIASFVGAHLPPTPARVLEIGCGQGDLATSLADIGYRTVAIDPHAPDGDIFEPVSLEEFAGRGPFDAVLANRALHHIPSLVDALDKIACLLRSGGRLIVREHAWERMDGPTARWYLQHRSRAHAATQSSLEGCLDDWNADHADLHGYAEMRAELDRRFKERFFAWTPYLYGELGGPEIEREERALIEAGKIKALGFYYVGEA